MLSTIKTYIISSLLICLFACSTVIGQSADLDQSVDLDQGDSAIQGTEIEIATLLELPSMSMGTQIQIVSPDLTTNFGLASVVDGELILETELEPYDEVRLLISHAGTGEVAMPTAFVSEEGNDLMLHIPDSDFVSFREWLSRERGLRMIFPKIAAAN